MRPETSKLTFAIKVLGLAITSIGVIGTHLALNRDPSEASALQSGFLLPMFGGFLLAMIGQGALFEFPAMRDGNWSGEAKKNLKTFDREIRVTVLCLLLILSVMVRIGFSSGYK